MEDLSEYEELEEESESDLLDFELDDVYDSFLFEFSFLVVLSAR